MRLEDLNPFDPSRYYSADRKQNILLAAWVYLPAANRNAFYIHVGRQVYVCARDSSYTQLTADT